MSNVPPTPAEEARDLRQLLTAVLEAVTLPTDTPDYERRILDRALWVRAALKGALAEDPANIGWDVDYLRGKLRTEETEATERAVNRCARCRWTFDPHDKRFDGHARHGETPFCRRCVDKCHDSGTEHVCQICDPQRYGGAR